MLDHLQRKDIYLQMALSKNHFFDFIAFRHFIYSRIYFSRIQLNRKENSSSPCLTPIFIVHSDSEIYYFNYDRLKYYLQPSIYQQHILIEFKIQHHAAVRLKL